MNNVKSSNQKLHAYGAEIYADWDVYSGKHPRMYRADEVDAELERLQKLIKHKDAVINGMIQGLKDVAPDETPARRYHANGTYWSGVPTVDMPCDFCGRGITDHDPRTHACSQLETSGSSAVLKRLLLEAAEDCEELADGYRREAVNIDALHFIAETYQRAVALRALAIKIGDSRPSVTLDPSPDVIHGMTCTCCPRWI